MADLQVFATDIYNSPVEKYPCARRCRSGLRQGVKVYHGDVPHINPLGPLRNPRRRSIWNHRALWDKMRLGV